MAGHRWLGVAIVAAVIAVPVNVGVQSGGQGWPTIGGDWSNTRYSPLGQITAQNLTRLGGAWTSQKLEPSPSARAMPLVKDGLMFLTAPPFVYALNAKTGETAWRYQAGALPAPGNPFGGPGSPAREGVAVGEGLVFVGTSDARVIALREKTGEVAWSQNVGDSSRDVGQGASGAPLYAGGLVSIGLSADNGYRGQVVALDAKSGREAWRFYAVPGPGEPGQETWPKNSDAWKRGGGAVWLVGAADPDLGLVYYVTGNGVPQVSGEGRPGDNLYLCSVVALDMKTGKLRWHYQTIRHDIWEADISIAPVLYDAQVDGRPRKAVAAMRADGYLFMLDRETGKPLARIEDRPVPQDAFQKTAATQPFPVGADRLLPDCDEWKKQPTPPGFEIGCFFTPAMVQKPNVLAPNYGMRVTPMAFSPQTGYFYVTGNAGLGWLRRAEDPNFFSLGFNARVPGLNRYGYGLLAALDSRTNKVVWKKEFRVGRPSGALATATGLVFQMAGDGNFQAYDAKTGNVLWQFQTGTMGGGPPVAYDIDGEQHLAVVMSTHVLAFKLGGALKPQTPPATPPQQDFVGQIADTAQIETASLARDMGLTGSHYITDEFAFGPYRARVKAGTRVTWRNNGRMVHTVAAQDGSWTTGPLKPLDVGSVTFDKPATITYTCKEHPWAVAQLIVVE